MSGPPDEVLDHDVDKRAPGCERRLQSNSTSSTSRNEAHLGPQEEGACDAMDEMEETEQGEPRNGVGLYEGSSGEEFGMLDLVVFVGHLDLLCVKKQ